MELEQQVVEPVEGSQLEPTVTEPAVAEPIIETPTYYTPEEIKGLTPTDIDIEKVDPVYRPVVENTIRDYKALQADHTRKSQELAELKKVPDQPEVYFDDQNEDTAFKVYLTKPGEYLTALSMDIAKYDSVIPDDGIDEYRTARRWVAYLNGVKDRFLAKRIEISETRRNNELTDAKIQGELGEQAQAIIDYGRVKGFTEKELKTRPALLDMVKKEYLTSHATQTAIRKEVKPTPQKAATPAGGVTEGEAMPVDTSKWTDAQWYANKQKEQREQLKRKYGG